MKIKIIDNLAPEDNAMLLALYSRSPASVDAHLEKLQRVGSGAFMDQYYCGYGHQSIGDCGSTTIFIEGVTMLAAKAIQDWPLYSGQESSTRYMDFSSAKFANPLGISAGEAIQEAWRDFYLGAHEPLLEHLRNVYPIQNDDDPVVYKRAIAARAFDILRAFLPAGAATNLGWHVNLRQAADHLQSLVCHPDPAIAELARTIRSNLALRYSHSFNGRTSDDQAAYYADAMAAHHFEGSGFWGNAGGGRDQYQDPCLENQLTLSSSVRLSQVGAKDRALMRRRPRGCLLPPRIAEVGCITSQFFLDFGSFRDLQRHRNGVVRMPLLTTRYGFHQWYLSQLPIELEIAAGRLIGQQEKNIEVLNCSDYVRQNYIAMGYRVPCRVVQSLPAFVYRVELRSNKTVHPTLREVILREISIFREIHPSVTLHVDEDPDSWTVRRGRQTIEER